MEASIILNSSDQKRLMVLNTVVAGHSTLAEAAASLGLSQRQVRRVLAAYRQEGAAALAHGNRGRRPVCATSHNAALRGSIARLGQPYLLEVIVAAPNRDELTALVFPNMPALRAHFAAASAECPEDAELLRRPEVRALFADIFARHNQEHPRSSERFARVLLLAVPPRLDQNETTDKGYINQLAVLRARSDEVERLYQSQPDEEVIELD